jgi:hypothetical protein
MNMTIQSLYTAATLKKNCDYSKSDKKNDATRTTRNIIAITDSGKTLRTRFRSSIKNRNNQREIMNIDANTLTLEILLLLLLVLLLVILGVLVLVILVLESEA